MTSELLRLLLDNVSKLGPLDFFILFFLALSVASSAAVVIHWIYKHALEKQGEVIKSQDKLIEIKDKNIAEYERTIKRLTDEKATSDLQLAETVSRIDELREEIASVNSEGRERHLRVLLLASGYAIGVRIAQALFARIEYCHNMRQLVNVYAAVLAQHNDHSGAPISQMLIKIGDTEEFFLNQSRILNRLDNFVIGDKPENVPQLEAILSFSENTPNLDKRLDELQQHVIKNTIVLLQKYEPRFASDVEKHFTASR